MLLLLCRGRGASFESVVSGIVNKEIGGYAYRGDSGSQGVVPHRMKKKRNWKASGNRQATEPPANDSP